MRMNPASSRSSPASSRSAEVLPEPLSPTSTVVLPALAWNAMSSENEPRCLPRWVSSTEDQRSEPSGAEPDGEQDGEGEQQQQDREGDGRVEVALEGEVHGQRHGLSDAG